MSDLNQQKMNELARELIAVWSRSCFVASLAAIAASTQIWEYPLPRSLFLHIGVWLLLAGLVLAYGAYSSIDEPDIPTFNRKIIFTIVFTTFFLLAAMTNLVSLSHCFGGEDRGECVQTYAQIDRSAGSPYWRARHSLLAHFISVLPAWLSH